MLWSHFRRKSVVHGKDVRCQDTEFRGEQSEFCIVYSDI
jgi:hypothetical protein